MKNILLDLRDLKIDTIQKIARDLGYDSESNIEDVVKYLEEISLLNNPDVILDSVGNIYGAIKSKKVDDIVEWIKNAPNDVDNEMKQYIYDEINNKRCWDLAEDAWNKIMDGLELEYKRI